MDDEYEFLLKVGRVNHLPEFKRNKEIKTNLKFFMLSILLIFALYSMIYSEDLSLQTIEKKDDSITGYSIYEQNYNDLRYYNSFIKNSRIHPITYSQTEPIRQNRDIFSEQYQIKEGIDNYEAQFNGYIIEFEKEPIVPKQEKYREDCHLRDCTKQSL